MSAEQMLQADRHYWSIETGLHLRLDVTAGEDRSRVRHRTSALNLAVIRRAVVRVAVHWIKRCRSPRQATLSGFYDFMSEQHQKSLLPLNCVQSLMVTSIVNEPYRPALACHLLFPRVCVIRIGVILAFITGGRGYLVAGALVCLPSIRFPQAARSG